MKKLFFTFLFLINFLISVAQTNYYFNTKEYGTWKVSGQAICGLGNAYCTVIKSETTNEYGNYIYQVYFSTNSYFNNCQVSRTYIPYIYVYYVDNLGKYVLPLNYFPFWITVGQTTLVYTLFHPNPYLKLWISVGQMEPTNY